MWSLNTTDQAKQELSFGNKFVGRCKLSLPVTLPFDLVTPKFIVVFHERGLIRMRSLDTIDQSKLKLSSGNKFVDGQIDGQTDRHLKTGDKLTLCACLCLENGLPVQTL